MTLNESDSVRVALVRQQGQPIIVTVEVTRHEALVATPIPVEATPAVAIARAFGPAYKTCVWADLVVPTEVFSVEQVQTDCQSLNRSVLTWEWLILAKAVGNQKLLVAIEVVWTPTDNQNGKIKRKIWQETLDVSVVRPFITLGQLNISTVLTSLLGLVFIAPWAYVRTRDNREGRRLVDDLSEAGQLDREQTAYLRTLYGLIIDRFDLQELQMLCFILGIDYDSLPGETKPVTVRELVKLMVRTDRLTELVDALRRERPLVHWPAIDDT